MIFSTECGTYIFKRLIRKSSAQIHCYMPWISYTGCPCLLKQVFHTDFKMLRNNLLYKVHSNDTRFVRTYEVLKCFLGKFQIYISFLKSSLSRNFIKCALKLSYIFFYIGCNILYYSIIYIKIIGFFLFSEYSHSGLIIRRIDIHNKTGFKS